MLAQLGNPDMRTPIAHALAFPERVESGVPQLDLAQVASLSFEKHDYARFPCLALAIQVLAAGGIACVALNAANEVAVDAFLTRRIGFTEIAQTVAAALDSLSNLGLDGLEDVLEVDSEAGSATLEFIAARASRASA